VGSLDHLRALATIPNVAGAVVGRALYEHAFTLDEALVAAGA
jgi:phosphoribosylformimino-5-aminoimidazole carboxamide ribonucleotide (ProFAR) isomerase